MVNLFGRDIKVVDLSQEAPLSQVDPGFRARETWAPEDGPARLERSYFSSPLINSEAKAEADRASWKISRDAFPDGRFLSNEWFTVSSHFGTHVDAPAHYGAPGATKIAQVPLESLMGEAVVLHPRIIGDRITAGSMAAATSAHGDSLPRIVLIRTDSQLTTESDAAYFTKHAGLTLGALEVLLDAGVEVVGTDGASLDRPSSAMIEEFLTSGDKSVMWPCHLEGRQRPFLQVERLANLNELPFGESFTFMALPIKLSDAGAAWCRAIALVPDAQNYGSVA